MYMHAQTHTQTDTNTGTRTDARVCEMKTHAHTHTHTHLFLAFTIRDFHAGSSRFVMLTFNVSRHIIQDHLMIEPKVRSFEYDLSTVYLIFSVKHVVKMRHLCLCIHLIVQIVFIIQTPVVTKLDHNRSCPWV